MRWDCRFSRFRRHDDTTALDVEPTDRLSSIWIVLGSNAENLGPLPDHPDWTRVGRYPKTPTWTDDFSSILQVLHW